MSKVALALLSLALLATVAYGDYFDLCPDSKATCSSSSSLSLVVIGEGECSASANSYCSAWIYESEDCIDKDEKFEDGECREVHVDADAECWAAAVAVAFTNAYATVLCDGGDYAYGCAGAEAEAEALACSFAAAIVEISVNLGDYTAECDAKIVAAIRAIARAAAESAAGSCSSNGYPGIDSDTDLAVAIHEVLAEAFAKCWVYCDGYGRSDSEVSGHGSASPTEEEEIESGDGADASVGGK